MTQQAGGPDAAAPSSAPTPLEAGLLPDGPAQGPAFPLAVRVLATVLVAYTAHWGWQSRTLLAGVEWTWAGLTLLVAAGVDVVPFHDFGANPDTVMVERGRAVAADARIWRGSASMKRLTRMPAAPKRSCAISPPIS